jgi:lipopolysaccharide transport system ATP-binding protein
MSHDIAISVRGLSKSYTINHDEEKHATLASTVAQRIKNPFKRSRKETFWALKEVSFDIKKGDVVGIIGRNGAGKSTLLKILSRITEPTEGEIDVYGRIGALLEVGTGFSGELTGRENIFLNGSILGMSKADIRKQFDAIVDFSGVQKFLDTPVKRYSSGMYVRLAFAVAAHLNPEVLIIDEVLAVGDSEFQKKCLGKMKDVSAEGRTVLFVSHNLAAVRELCNHGVLMNSGTVILESSIEKVTQRYLQQTLAARTQLGSSRSTGFAGVRLCDQEANTISATSLLDQAFIEIVVKVDFGHRVTAGITIYNSDHIPLVTTTLADCSQDIEHGLHTFRVSFPCELLASGEYHIEGTVWDSSKVYDHDDNLCAFTVMPSPGFESRPGHVYPGQLIWRKPWVNVKEVQLTSGYANV